MKEGRRDILKENEGRKKRDSYLRRRKDGGRTLREECSSPESEGREASRSYLSKGKGGRRVIPKEKEGKGAKGRKRRRREGIRPQRKLISKY